MLLIRILFFHNHTLQYNMHALFGKINHFSKIHYIALYNRYTHTLSKHSDRITIDGQACNSQYRQCGITGGFNRTPWIHSIFLSFASSAAVVSDWCDDLFGIWLELGVPLSAFLLTGSLLLSPTATTPSHPPNSNKHHPQHYSYASKSLPKSSRVNYQWWF